LQSLWLGTVGHIECASSSTSGRVQSIHQPRIRCHKYWARTNTIRVRTYTYTRLHIHCIVLMDGWMDGWMDELVDLQPNQTMASVVSRTRAGRSTIQSMDRDGLPKQRPRQRLSRSRSVWLDQSRVLCVALSTIVRLIPTWNGTRPRKVCHSLTHSLTHYHTCSRVVTWNLLVDTHLQLQVSISRCYCSAFWAGVCAYRLVRPPLLPEPEHKYRI
jgi:hypothetical protein